MLMSAASCEGLIAREQACSLFSLCVLQEMIVRVQQVRYSKRTMRNAALSEVKRAESRSMAQYCPAANGIMKRCAKAVFPQLLLI